VARPHTVFVQSQALPWSVALENVRPGVTCKVLSEDADSGASTRIVRYPAGYDSPERGITADEEWFVLDGEITLDGMRYGYHDYAYLPAGLPRRRLSSAAGAVVLTMLSCEPRAASDATSCNESRLIRRLDTFALPWEHGAGGSVTGRPLGPGLAVKHLRRDLETGEQSFLYACLPHHPPPAVMVGKFTHPVVEEIFTLEGEYVFSDAGVMRPGGYCWWREGEWHGPAGSRAGYSLFIRVLGGALRNEFDREPYPFRYDPPYMPALPETLREAAAPLEWPPKW